MSKRKRNRNKNIKNMHVVTPSVESRLGKYKVFVVGSSVNSAVWMNMQRVDCIAEADIVLFTGGEDINPAIYGEEVGRKTSFNDRRDQEEIKAYNTALNLGKKMLGICRGGQLLTALNGGKLIQHVTGHHGNHDMTMCWRGNRDVFKMTSSHHQMFFPYNLPHDKFRILAYSTAKLSATYLNGEDKEIQLPKYFREPEIVLFTETKSLAIQGHPEWLPYYDKTNKELRDMLVVFMEIKEFKNVNYEGVNK